jgi:hypothetical protein
MDELIELGLQTGCWYRIFKEEGNDYVICRTGMTHISFKVDLNNLEMKTELDMKEEMNIYLDIHKKINRRKDKNYQSVWNILGYCGTMFLDWLDESKKCIESEIESETGMDVNKNKKLIMQIYIDGLKVVIKSLNEIL